MQLYVRREHAGSGDAVQELRGFQRIHLAPG
ncbi:fibronectin type III-like domain-contianing protein, partial [Enterobacter hormaechei]